MRILVDTNILTRVSQPASAQHWPARNAVEALVFDDHALNLPTQVLYEFWVVATRPVEQNGLAMPVSDATTAVADFLASFHLLHDTPDQFALWRDLVRTYDVKGKPAHDARLVAAMKVHAMDTLLTFNKPDFTRYPDIRVLTPQEVLDGRS